VLIDYYATFNGMRDLDLPTGGLYMLDGSMHRVFQVESAVEVVRKTMVVPFLIPMSTEKVAENTAVAIARGIDITTQKILNGINEKLGQR